VAGATLACFFFSTLWRLCCAPRAWSSRSGRTSSASLRPACACDRAGTPRGGAPRCSHETAPATPHRETPARFPHPQARWLLWPAGRISPPPSRRPECCLKGLSGVFLVGGYSIRLAGGAAIVSGGHGDPGVRIRGGVSGTRLFADTEGPHSGPHCRVVASGVSARREWGRARAEQGPHPPGKTRASTQWKQENTRPPRHWQNNPPRSGKERTGHRGTGKKRKPSRS
jgi:hypothetical protein